VDGYDFSGPTRLDRLFTGIAVERPAFPGLRSYRLRGIGPKDTFDGDYGRLLDQISVKRVASPRPASLNQITLWLRRLDGLRSAA